MEELKTHQLIGIITFSISLLGLILNALQAQFLTSNGIISQSRRSALMILMIPLALMLTSYEAPSTTVPLAFYFLQAQPEIEIALALDALGLIMCLVVATIGAIVVLFSARYMCSEPRQGVFMRWLLLTLVATITMTVIDSTIVFAACWMATSLCLHQLLIFYPHRPEARRCASTKFIISRLGDIGVLAGFILCAQSSGSFSFHSLNLLNNVDHLNVKIAAICFAVGALTKSAQVPFHIWLPRSLETPTPVSALMHAGIINAGGFLLLRTNSVISGSTIALSLLIIIGTLTAVYGMSCMVTQTSIKKRLAYSTIGQMGFMIAEIGLGFSTAALLHIVGHGYYKACAFLRSGSALEQEREQRFFPTRNIPSWQQVGLSTATLAVCSLIGILFFPLTTLPIVVVVSSAAIYLCQSILLTRSWLVAQFATLLIASIVILYFIEGSLLSYVMTTPQWSTLWHHWHVQLSCVISALLLFGAGLLQLSSRKLTQNMLGQKLVIHLHSGLYIDALLDRLTSLRGKETI